MFFQNNKIENSTENSRIKLFTAPIRHYNVTIPFLLTNAQLFICKFLSILYRWLRLSAYIEVDILVFVLIRIGVCTNSEFTFHRLEEYLMLIEITRWMYLLHTTDGYDLHACYKNI